MIYDVELKDRAMVDLAKLAKVFVLILTSYGHYNDK